MRKQNQQKRIIEHRLVVFYTGTKLQQTGKVNERLTGLRGKKTKRINVALYCTPLSKMDAEKREYC